MKGPAVPAAGTSGALEQRRFARPEITTATDAPQSARGILEALACGRLGCQCEASARRGSGLTHCPAHDDRTPSLSVRTDAGRLLVHCFACPQDAVVAALRARGLWPGSERRPKARTRTEPAAIYQYRDERGELLFEVLRYEPKAFKQRSPDGRGGWRWTLDGVRRVLYRLPEVLEAVGSGREVWVVEGEKDADRLASLGLAATTCPGGAGKWRPEYGEALRGARVRIVADRDEPGRRHALEVAASLRSIAAEVRLLEPAAGKDISDHLDAGLGLEDLVEVPLPPREDGAAILDEVEAFIRRYVVLPSDAAYVAVALWAAHSHALDYFESTPRLALLSPEPESGKTRTLEVLELLVPHPMLSVNATPAALFRAVARQDERPTLLFDEVDTLFGPKAKENEELRGLLNAGHRRSGVAYRCVGEGTNQEVKAFPAFAAVALAGIGDLPDTIVSRSIVIPMRRRAPHEQVQPFRAREAETEGRRLRERLERWVREAAAELARIPEMPEGVTDRAADVWEPLLAIADAAGGEWPKRARSAALELLRQRAEREPSLRIRLLADIRAVFEADGRHAIPTSELLERLYHLEEAPWNDLRGRPLDSRRLANLLREFGIRSRTIRIGHATPRGYAREDFLDAWGRYLPSLSDGSATSATSATPPDFESAEGADDVAGTAGVADTSATPRPSATLSRFDVALVADVADLPEEETEDVDDLSCEDDAPLRPPPLPTEPCAYPGCQLPRSAAFEGPFCWLHAEPEEVTQ